MISRNGSAYRRIGRVVRAAAVSAALVLGLGPAVVHAQTALDREGAGEAGERSRRAIYNGYGAGYEHGARDAVSTPAFDPRDDDVLEAATSGYTTDMGEAGPYRDAFRQAYLQGYKDGYHGHDRSPAMSMPPARSVFVPGFGGIGPGAEVPGGSGDAIFLIAATNGYNAGYEQGAESRRQRATFAYRLEEAYQAATRGYESSLGGRGQYQSLFRQAYTRGYSDGFHGRVKYSNSGQADGPDD
jgi:hypothetical protein